MKHGMTGAALLLSAMALAMLPGCGANKQLSPKAAASLPQKPYGATRALTPTELITASTQARPTRSDELLTRSEARRSDEFDLPPPN